MNGFKPHPKQQQMIEQAMNGATFKIARRGNRTQFILSVLENPWLDKMMDDARKDLALPGWHESATQCPALKLWLSRLARIEIQRSLFRQEYKCDQVFIDEAEGRIS